MIYSRFWRNVCISIYNTMKKSVSTIVVLGLLLIPALVFAQPEMPKKPAQRPQTGGAEGQVRKSETRSSGNERPVYYPRPTYYPTPVYPVQIPNTGNGNNGNINTPPSVDNTAEVNRAKALNRIYEVMSEFRAPYQTFDISDVTREFEIVGEKGFRVVFPELAFVDDEGNIVLGEVEVKLTEYTSNTEFAEAGLTTLTTSGELLETGGMINLEASSGGKKVHLSPGKEVTIEVPDLKNQEGFRTFYGSGTDIITWSTEPTNSNSDTTERPFDGYTIKMLKSTQSINGNAAQFVIFKNWKPLDAYVNENLKVSDDVRKNIKKDGIPFIYTIEFNAMGKIKSVKPKYPEYSKNTLISEIQGQIKGLLMDAPPLALNDGNLENGKSYDLVFATAKNYIDGKGPLFISAPLNNNPKTKPTSVETNVNPNAENVSSFAMNSSQLTKINCDKFSGSSSKDTQTFHFERADALVYIVFLDQRSLIQPKGSNGHYEMHKVPTGSLVRYVAVVYGDDGSIRMGTLEERTKNGKVEIPATSEFSAEALKAALSTP